MDFKAVLSALIGRFEEHGVRYGLMGGFALGLLGVGKSTVDIDFLVHRDDMDAVDQIMKDLDYECKFKSENASQYLSPARVFGEVDFLHAFRKASLEMLDNAVEMKIFDGAFKIRVLKPEDIIGLKLQAIKNDPSRERIDMQDIRALAAVCKHTMDWRRIEQYCNIFHMNELYFELRKNP